MRIANSVFMRIIGNTLALTVGQTGHNSSQELFSNLREVLRVLELGVLSPTSLGLLVGHGKDILSSLGIFERHVDMPGTTRQLEGSRWSPMSMGWAKNLPTSYRHLRLPRA